MRLDITKRYGTHTVLDRFRLELKKGEITCILGQSGCGKTTILQCIAGLVPYEGEISGRPERVSYIFQRERLLENLTVRGNLRYALSGEKLPDAEARIDRILAQVELTEAAGQFPRTLSGGMAQRVSIARGFVYPSELLLMDEPFRGLDLGLKHRVMAHFLRAWEADGRTTIFVTHAIDEALMLAGRIVLLGADAKILLDLDCPLSKRGRKLSDPAVAALRSQIFETLGI